jgi:transcriptional regulator with XRE-family HTH domain
MIVQVIGGQVMSKLERVRRMQALTQEELAERSGVTRSTISRLEDGLQQARPSTLRKLAAALGVPPSEILDWDEDTEDKAEGRTTK